MKNMAGVVVLIAGVASAQTMTYFWTVTTDDGDTNVGVKEWAYLSLWALMEPERVGLAGTSFDIRGVRHWNSGQIEYFGHRFDPGWDDDYVDGNNDIRGIEVFQLPPLFNPSFASDNPIELAWMVWRTDDYTARVIEVGDANHLNNDVYTDEFGSSVSYEGIPGVARFTVGVPGPGALALLGATGLGAAVRRR